MYISIDQSNFACKILTVIILLNCDVMNAMILVMNGSNNVAIDVATYSIWVANNIVAIS